MKKKLGVLVGKKKKTVIQGGGGTRRVKLGREGNFRPKIVSKNISLKTPDETSESINVRTSKKRPDKEGRIT